MYMYINVCERRSVCVCVCVRGKCALVSVSGGVVTVDITLTSSQSSLACQPAGLRALRVELLFYTLSSSALNVCCCCCVLFFCFSVSVFLRQLNCPLQGVLTPPTD